MAMDKLDNKKIAIIGGGHIGQAFVEGFINSGKITGSQLIVTNPSLSKLIHLKKLGVEVTSNNKVAARKADMIFLAVTPPVIGQVLEELKELLEGKHVISLAAVISIKSLQKHVSATEIIRIMPNMAVFCNQGVIGIFSKKKDISEIKQLLSTLGSVIEVEKEEDLDSLTLLSGCGPAIISQLIEMLAAYGIKIGLSSDISHVLAEQTFRGTTAILKKSKQSPSQLIDAVSTKGGISEAIVQLMQKDDLDISFSKAMDAGYKKLIKMKKSLSHYDLNK